MHSDTFTLEAGTPATITVLNQHWKSQNLPGQVLETKGRVVVLKTGAPLKNGTAVSVEVSGGMVLAEVETATRSGSGEWEVHLKADQFIPSLTDLANLMEAVMREGSAGRATDRRAVRSA